MARRRRYTTPFAFLYLFWPSSANNASNRTIDDENGDSVTGAKPAYNGNWNYGPNCTTCIIKPDTTRLIDGTWHEITSGLKDKTAPSISLTFNGTAIYAYTFAPDTIPSALFTSTNLTFLLDEKQAAPAHRKPGPKDTIVYNFPVFSTAGLPNTEHTLKILPQPGSYLAFDYAVYTSDDDTPTPSSSTLSSTPIGLVTESLTSTASASQHTSVISDQSSSNRFVPAIVGGAVGGLMVVLATVLALLYVRRRSRRRSVDTDDSTLKMKQIRPPREQGHAANPGSTDALLLWADQQHTMTERPKPVVHHKLSGLRYYPAVQSNPASATARHNMGEGSVDATGSLSSSADNLSITNQFTGTVSQGAIPAAETMRTDGLPPHSQPMDRSTADLIPRRIELSTAPPSQPSDLAIKHGTGTNEETLRHQVGTLQAEVKRLKMQQYEVLHAGSEPPPAYAARS